MSHEIGRFGPEDPPVTLIGNMPKEMVEDLKRLGYFRCGVLVPDCNGEPAAEVFRAALKINVLFCRKHAAQACDAEGYPIPVWPEDMN